MSNIFNETITPFWIAPPLDAWRHHRGKLTILFIYYVVCFAFGQFVNWLCLLNINKTELSQCARYLMITQCVMNTWYITINFPYKATILYLQKVFLPWPLNIFCGWLHLTIVFGSMFLQDVMAITRVLYIVFPLRANYWLNTRLQCVVLPVIPVTFGLLYGIPSLNPCCHRLYKFTSYAMTYIGPMRDVQLRFSFAASLLFILTFSTCYTWIVIVLKKSNAEARELRDGTHTDQREKRVAALFGITGGIWFFYLILFYPIQWTVLFEPYSVLLLINEMLEQTLFFIDPIVYIGLSSELRKVLLNFFGVKSNSVSVQPTPAAWTESKP